MPTNSDCHTDLKITMTNTCNDLVQKVGNMHKKRGDFSRQMEGGFLEMLKILKF